MKNNKYKIGYLSASVMVSVLGFQSMALATTPPENPDEIYHFGSGIACEFPLSIEKWGTQDIKEFKEKNGMIRTLSAGKGAALRFTNDETGKTLSTKANGSVEHRTTYSSDGSFTVSATGHNVIIWVPTDVPPGPSTMLYIGNVTYSSDSDYNFTLIKESKNKTDICAALSP